MKKIFLCKSWLEYHFRIVMIAEFVPTIAVCRRWKVHTTLKWYCRYLFTMMQLYISPWKWPKTDGIWFYAFFLLRITKRLTTTARRTAVAFNLGAHSRSAVCTISNQASQEATIGVSQVTNRFGDDSSEHIFMQVKDSHHGHVSNFFWNSASEEISWG